MYKLEFTLKQHTPLIHHLGIEDWSGLQSKAVSPILNTFIVEKITKLNGAEAIKQFKDTFINNCIHFNDRKWNAGFCNPGNCANVENCIYKKWFRNKKEVEALALNYDLHFQCEVDSNASYYEKIINQCQAHIVYKNREIAGDIICSAPSLMEYIKNILPKFFILTGFGYRSSKGFGCFTIKDITEKIYKEVLKEKYNVNNNCVVFKYEVPDSEITKFISRTLVHECKKYEKRKLNNLNENERKEQIKNINKNYIDAILSSNCEFDHNNKLIKWTNQFTSNGQNHNIPHAVLSKVIVNNICNIFYKTIQEIIDQHWKYIKSGTNYPYHKSLLWLYFCGGDEDNKIGWEKRFIKQSLKANHLNIFDNLKRYTTEMRFETINTPTNFMFYRALLGLAEHYEYALKKNFTINNKSSININVKSNNPDIERIPSPVRFKVFEHTIFLIVNSVDENINEALFQFFYKEDVLKLGEIDKLKVQIPINGLKDCFEKILLNTNDLKSGHPLCNIYNLLKYE